MRESDIEKMAFCQEGLFKFLWMPFGLKNVSATLQQALDLLKAGLMWEEVLIYLANLIVFAPTFEVFLE